MKRFLTFFITVVAIITTYFYHKQSSTYNVLEYIPEDTPVFAGMLSPFPIKDYLILNRNILAPNASEQIWKEEVLYTSPQPAWDFLTKLKQTYELQLHTPEQFLKTFGLADNVRSYFYTLGLLPVFKLEVAEPKAIWALLDKTEQETNFTHQKGKLNELEYRRYRLTPPEVSPLELIIAVDNGLLTVTFHTDFISEGLMANALGLEKVTNSLAKSSVLDDIIKKHNLLSNYVGFLNHIEIIKGITTDEDSLLAKQLTELKRLNANIPNTTVFEMPECKQELAGIAKNWPRTIVGYSEFELNSDESTIAVEAIIESKNQILLTALKSLRGYVPGYTQNYGEHIFAASLGLDIHNLSSALTDIWEELSQPRYQCSLLAGLQADLVHNGGQSLAMIGMVSSSLSGVKGISSAVFDYSLKREKYKGPELAGLDGLVAIYADDPKAVFNSIKAFVPGLQQAVLENNGSSVDLKGSLPFLAELELTPQLAIKGQYIVAYTGPKAKQKAEKLGLEQRPAKGVFQLFLDSKGVTDPIVEAAEKDGGRQPFSRDMMYLLDYDLNINTTLDINEQGIRLGSKVKQKR